MAKKSPNPIDKHVGSRVRMRRMMVSHEPGEARRTARHHLSAGAEIREGHEPDRREPPAADCDRAVGAGRILLRRRPGPARRRQRHVGAGFPCLRLGIPRHLRGPGADQGVHEDQGPESAPPHRRSRRGASPATSAAERQLAARQLAHHRPHLDRAPRSLQETLPSEASAIAPRGWQQEFPVSRSNYLFTSESVSEGHPDKVCDRISDEIVDAFFALGRSTAGTHAAARRLRDAGAPPTASCSPARRAVPPRSRRRSSSSARARRSRTSATSRRASTGRTPRSRCCCTPSPPTSRKASTPPATRTKAPATRASCSATPADETPELMPAPLHYSHNILKLHGRGAPLRRDARRSARTPRARSPCATRTASRWRRPQIVVSTQHIDADADRRATCRRSSSPTSARRCPTGWITENHRLARQPDRQVRHRRPGRRLRPHRPQDHRRHLRRRGPARRRRVLGQGPDQGRPLGRLRRALSRQERGRRRSRRPLHHPDLLRDRRVAAAVDLRRPARHRPGRRGQAREGAAAR